MCVSKYLLCGIIVVVKRQKHKKTTKGESMKNTKSKLLGLVLSASFVLSAAAPAVASASAEDVVTTNYAATQIDPSAVSPEKINDIIAKAEGLRSLLKGVPSPIKGPYVQALDKVIGTLKKIDPSKAGPRVELASKTVDAIKFSIKDIQDKTKKAHVDIGVEITKAAITLADPKLSSEQAAKAIENLKNAEEKAKESADITDNDVATIYVKKPLEELIREAKKLIRSKDLTKEEKEELTKAIREAVHTKNKVKVTVGEISDAQANLLDVVSSLTADEVEEPVEDETIDPEFNNEDVNAEETEDEEVPEDAEETEDEEVPEDTEETEDEEVPEDAEETEDEEVPEDTEETEDEEVPEDTEETEDEEVPEDTEETEDEEVPEDAGETEDEEEAPEAPVDENETVEVNE